MTDKDRFLGRQGPERVSLVVPGLSDCVAVGEAMMDVRGRVLTSLGPSHRWSPERVLAVIMSQGPMDPCSKS